MIGGHYSMSQSIRTVEPLVRMSSEPGVYVTAAPGLHSEGLGALEPLNLCRPRHVLVLIGILSFPVQQPVAVVR